MSPRCTSLADPERPIEWHRKQNIISAIKHLLSQICLCILFTNFELPDLQRGRNVLFRSYRVLLLQMGRWGIKIHFSLLHHWSRMARQTDICQIQEKGMYVWHAGSHYWVTFSPSIPCKSLNMSIKASSIHLPGQVADFWLAPCSCAFMNDSSYSYYYDWSISISQLVKAHKQARLLLSFL